jgi:microcystin-dependent protein
LGTKYSSQAVSGFDSSPPVDDGSATEANKVKWSTIKSKLASPLKTFGEAINSALVTALDQSCTAVTSNTSASDSDHDKTIQVNTSSVTITLADATTMAAGYVVSVSNNSSGDVSVALSSATDTIDTITNAVQTLAAHETRKYIVNAAATGYLTAAEGNGIPVGVVMPYAGATAPGGWLFCYGQAVSRTTYARLFEIVGETYGTADGVTTFNLPDLRGRVVAGQDDMGGSSANRLTGVTGSVNGDTLGGTGGAETHTLTEAEMPAHTHNELGSSVATFDGGAGSPADTTAGGQRATTSTGGGGAHNNVQPTIILNYIIKF